MTSIADCVRTGARALEQAGWTPDDGRRDAEALARGLLNWDTATWLAERREAAPPAFVDAFAESLARRLRHEPVAYIVGAREFYGRLFSVTRDVLIPRPETELVVDEALAVIDAKTSAGHAVCAVVDVGTGSGCLAVTLALERPGLRVIATDISAGALAVAATNAARLGAADRVRFVRTSLADGLEGTFDVIVSNPPYVSVRDRASLMPDVRDYEPHEALYGGDDGLEMIRAVIDLSGARLRPGGSLVMELGAGQSGDAAERVSASTGLRLVRVAPDLNGIPRVLVAERPPGS